MHLQYRYPFDSDSFVQQLVRHLFFSLPHYILGLIAVDGDLPILLL
jgi:hypothetical protein